MSIYKKKSYNKFKTLTTEFAIILRPQIRYLRQLFWNKQLIFTLTLRFKLNKCH